MRATSPINKRLLPVNDAAAYLGIGRNTLYKLIGAGDLPTVPIGARTLLDRDDLDAYIERAKGMGSEPSVKRPARKKSA